MVDRFPRNYNIDSHLWAMFWTKTAGVNPRNDPGSEQKGERKGGRWRAAPRIQLRRAPTTSETLYETTGDDFEGPWHAFEYLEIISSFAQRPSCKWQVFHFKTGCRFAFDLCVGVDLVNAAAAATVTSTITEEPASISEEEGEVQEVSVKPKEKDEDNLATPVKEKGKDAPLRIDTASSAPVKPRRRPGPLDLLTTFKPNIPLPSLPPSLLPSPKVELNINVKGGKFRYDREFLLQFMSICKEKPDMLPPLDAIGIGPVDQHSMACTNSRRGTHRPGRTPSVSGTSSGSNTVGFPGFGAKIAPSGGMSNFVPGPKLTSQERYEMASGARVVLDPGSVGASGRRQHDVAGMRPLSVSLGQIKVSIRVSTSTDEWISAEVLRDEFVHEQSLVDAIDTTAQPENEAEATVEVAAHFLGFIAQKIHQSHKSTAARTSLLLNVFKHFTSTYLRTEEIHCLIAAYDINAFLHLYDESPINYEPPHDNPPRSRTPSSAGSGSLGQSGNSRLRRSASLNDALANEDEYAYYQSSNSQSQSNSRPTTSRLFYRWPSDQQWTATGNDGRPGKKLCRPSTAEKLTMLNVVPNCKPKHMPTSFSRISSRCNFSNSGNPRPQPKTRPRHIRSDPCTMHIIGGTLTCCALYRIHRLMVLAGLRRCQIRLQRGSHRPHADCRRGWRRLRGLGPRVKAGFVSAVLNAGYHVELASSGHYNTLTLRFNVAEIRSKIPPGVGSAGVEERFAGVNGGGDKPSLLQLYTSLDDPLPFIEAYPITTLQLLASEDLAFFLAISQQPGQKPALFIPVLDASFQVWFKKAAEDIEAIFDQGPQHVCILQGPIAIKHSKVKDEPIKDLPGNINSALIQRLLDFRYGGDESKVPTVDYLSVKPVAPPAVSNIKHTETNGEVVYEFRTVLPETSTWLDILTGPHLSWLRALATSATVVQGTSYIDNPMGCLLAPRPRQKVVVAYYVLLMYYDIIFGAAPPMYQIV
ncbi:Fatty acid synthase [Mycena venus]|uniref:Fatty acid synthase n=1 Tax=Mycena venus TaxID=2733690 RepID=A0A8H7CP66_9AGAR|nr:Fatty acid synthase [Mycena venus]